MVQHGLALSGSGLWPAAVSREERNVS